ncbi:Ig-like domain-containing protein [uncultured Algibacter sp.]|uniref:beta strand repeat-containing protein n=1 Tax=uncultured Algibacter sp. TaxID=298659 RepID=UPI003217A60B
MKNTITFLTALLFSIVTFANTPLGPGDIAFIGLNLDGPDDYAFILLKDVDATTTITFTDRGWTGSGFSGFTGEASWTWTSGAMLTVGTVITITTNGSLSVSGGGSVSGAVPVLSGIGDQIFAYQGFDASPTFIAGIHSNFNGSTDMNWDGLSNSNQTSALPSTLTNGTNAIRLHATNVERDNWRYNCAVVSGDVATVRAAINNISNWNNDNGIPFSPVAPACAWNLAVNTAPVATAFSTPTVAEDATNVTLSGASISDAEAADTQTVTVTATGGTITLGGSTAASVMTTGNAATVTTALNTATFTPTSNFNGAASITVVSNDGTENSNIATVNFTVAAVNDEPSFTVGANQAVNEDAGAQTVTGFTTALEDGDAEVTQALLFNVSNNNNGLFSSQPAIDASGNLTYTPATDVTGSATITVNIMDNGGTANVGDVDTSADQTFTITVNAINDEPIFTLPAMANQTIAESTMDNAQSVNTFATMISDGDGDTQMLTFNVSNNNNGLFSAQPSIDTTTGTLSYTVAANQIGTATITANLMDNGGTANVGDDDTSDDQTFTIQVIDTPTITSITDDTGANTTDFITGDNTLSVSGTATPNSTITFTVNGNPIPEAFASTTVNPMGNYTFIIPTGFPFPATQPDGAGTLIATATINGVSVNSVSQAVTIDTADPVYTSATTINFAENATGTAYTAVSTDATAVTYSITGGADQADLSITTTGEVTFNATPDFEAAIDDNTDNDYIIEITATDLAGNTAVQTVTITVTDVDEIDPTVTITSSASPGPVNSLPIPVTVTFSEDVTGFDETDLILSADASVVNFSGSGTSYTFDLTTTQSSTTFTVDINAAVAMDSEGNNSEAATQFSIEYSNTTLGISESELSKKDFFFTNPVESILEINSAVIIETISVYTLNGTIVANTKGDKVDVSGLASGVYLAVVTTKKDKNITFKILKK